MANDMTEGMRMIVEAERRRKHLLEQLAAAPIVEIIGLVGEDSRGGTQGGDEEMWTMSFTLEAWRIDGAGIVIRPLKILQQVTEEEKDEWGRDISKYAVIRITARYAVEESTGEPHALLERFIGRDIPDAELEHHAAELQKPVIFEEPTLGTFTLDRRFGIYTATVVWEGEPVTLDLPDKEKTAALKTARTLWESGTLWDRRIREHAVHELLPLKNESWLDEDENEAEVGPDEFGERMSLQGIAVKPDASFEFYYDDGGLFFGHSIQVRGTLADGPVEADIVG